MLVPAVRASTAWLPTVIVDGVVVLIKKGIRYLVDQNNEKTPASLVRQPREQNSIPFVFVSNRRTRSTTATRVRVFNTRVIDKVCIAARNNLNEKAGKGCVTNDTICSSS